MKKKILFITILFISCFFLTGCNSNINSIRKINYQELEKKINDKETFILEVIQTGCSHCEEFSPILKSILKTNGLTAFSLNLSDLEKDEKTKLNKIAYVSGTPTVIFFKDGEEDTSHRIVGATSGNEIKAHLKDLGYLK